MTGRRQHRCRRSHGTGEGELQRFHCLGCGSGTGMAIDQLRAQPVVVRSHWDVGFRCPIPVAVSCVREGKAPVAPRMTGPEMQGKGSCMLRQSAGACGKLRSRRAAGLLHSCYRFAVAGVFRLTFRQRRSAVASPAARAEPSPSRITKVNPCGSMTGPPSGLPCVM